MLSASFSRVAVLQSFRFRNCLQCLNSDHSTCSSSITPRALRCSSTLLWSLLFKALVDTRPSPPRSRMSRRCTLVGLLAGAMLCLLLCCIQPTTVTAENMYASALTMQVRNTDTHTHARMAIGGRFRHSSLVDRLCDVSDSGSNCSLTILLAAVVSVRAL